MAIIRSIALLLPFVAGALGGLFPYLPVGPGRMSSEQRAIRDHTFGEDSASPLNAEFDDLVKGALREWHVPGLAIAVIDGNETYSKGYGISNFPSTKVTPDTLFFTGSTTKAFTAAALSFLVEDNENFPSIRWDTPVSDIIREDFVLEDDWYTNHVTLEDAASHRSGLPRHDLIYPSQENATVKMMVQLLRHLPLTASIRTKFQYCNLMYVTLSHVIQTLVKKPLDAFLRERIWAPLNMTSTTFSLSEAKRSGKLAHGYLYIPSNSTPRYAPEEWVDLDLIAGAGETISTVKDYAKWTYSLLNRLPPLSSSQHEAIMTPRSMVNRQGKEVALSGRPLFTGPQLYSLGWEHTIYRGEQLIGHDGGLPGFATRLIMVPSKKWGVVMMGNTAGSSNLAEMILCWHLVDELLLVPHEERYNWTAAFKKRVALEKSMLDHTRDVLFPHVPQPPIGHSLPLKDYAGHYWHPAYATLNLTLRRYSTPPPYYVRDDSSPPLHQSYHAEYLHALPSFRIWNFTADLHHVSCDYFMFDAVQPWPARANVTESDGLKMEGEVSRKGAVRFTIGPSGKVERMGVMLEDEMVVKAVEERKSMISDEAMIWFDKLA